VKADKKAEKKPAAKITLILSLAFISGGYILLGIFLFGLDDGLGLLSLGRGLQRG
jgi:hypothetical protein